MQWAGLTCVHYKGVLQVLIVVLSLAVCAWHRTQEDGRRLAPKQLVTPAHRRLYLKPGRQLQEFLVCYATQDTLQYSQADSSQR